MASKIPEIKTSEQAMEWERFLTGEELRKMEPGLAFNREILDFYRGQYGDIRDQYAQSGTQFGVPQEFRQATNLFRPGGQFGAGGRAEIRRGAQQALAGGQVGLTQTGMSSGTNVAGLRSRVAADEALARKKIEDQRVQLLADSLTEAGRAGLDVQRMSSTDRARLLQVLASFQPRFVSY